MQSEGPGRREGGGDDVEGLLKSAGAGEVRAEGRDWREKQEREGGRDSGLLPLLCGFLYTPWQAWCRLPRLPARPPGKVG